MTTDVDHISPELCLLGCHISTGKPPERGFQSFSLSKWRFADSFARGNKVSHGRNTAPSVCRTDPTQVGASYPVFALPSFISAGLSAHHLLRGSQLGLHAPQRRQPQCIRGPLTLPAVSTRQCCPEATSLCPLATVGDSASGTWSNFKQTYLNFFFNSHLFLLRN